MRRAIKLLARADEMIELRPLLLHCTSLLVAHSRHGLVH
jgi:hypothetical protein